MAANPNPNPAGTRGACTGGKKPPHRRLARWLDRMRCHAMIVLCGTLLATPAQTHGQPTSHAPPAATMNVEWGVGVWIWDTNAFAKQTCRLWRAFEIPKGATVASARFRITADNGFRLLFDGREVGRGSDWRSMTEYDLTWLLRPGTHVLAVEGFNDRLEAGILAGLRIELMDGSVIEIPSDATWHVVPEGERGWEHTRKAPAHWPQAVVVGQFGSPPWTTKPYGITVEPPLRPQELRFWQTGWFQVLLLSIALVAILVSLRLTTRLAVQAKAQELLHRERGRIARDIHDELGAGLTQLLLLGEVAQKETPATPEGRAQIERLCNKARGLSVALDEVIWLVNSRRDTLRDFVSQACKFAQSFLAETPIRCRLDIASELPVTPLDLPVRRNLFLAVKEAVNNAAKYSSAKELFLRIRREAADLVVEVEDNGCGFNPTAADPERNGLNNMVQRLTEIGGECRVLSEPGKGCKIIFRVSLEDRHSPESRALKHLLRRGSNAISEDPSPLPSNQASTQ